MRCSLCQQSGPTAYVELKHNVGMLLMRRVHTTRGELCRNCLGKRFWHHTLFNLLLGWWGFISFFATWFFLLSNTFTYVRARGRLGHESALAPVRGSSPAEEPPAPRARRAAEAARPGGPRDGDR